MWQFKLIVKECFVLRKIKKSVDFKSVYYLQAPSVDLAVDGDFLSAVWTLLGVIKK